MKKFVFAVVAAFLAASVQAAAKTYYVDAARLDDSGDGLTPETAKRHIQAAVDLCASGDTVKVAEGVYDDGVTTCAFDNARARVVITNKINLVATGAKEKTIIPGAFDPTTGGVGPGSVRCVYMYYQGVSSKANYWVKSKDSIVRGFTLCNGAASSGYGGGISMAAGYAVDCVISNCVAVRGGGTDGGVAVRCFVSNCRTSGENPYGTASSTSKFLNSILVHQSGSDRLMNYPSSIVNCTIAANNGNVFAYGTSKFKLYNSIYCFNSPAAFQGSAVPIASNCVFAANVTGWKLADCGNIVTNTSTYCFAAPAIGDWRPSAEMGAANAGDAALLTEIALPSSIEDQRYLDYYGNPIPKTGPITCGAVQEVCAAEGGLLTFDGDKGWEIDGFGALSTIQTSQNYVWTDDYQGMFKVRMAGAAKTNLVFYSQTTNGASFATLYPTMDDWTGIVALSGVTNKIAAKKPTKVLYVDAKDGDDESGDGSAANPYGTIYCAITNAPNGRSSNNYVHSVILVRPGEYKVGGLGGARVYIPNQRPGGNKDWWYKYFRIVAEEGPATTAIFGEKTVSCYNSSLPSILQGFTLTGVSDSSADGAVCIANSPSNGLVSDCIISNNTASSSLALRISLLRCRFVDNVMTGTGGCEIRGYNSGAHSTVIGCEIIHSSLSAAGSSTMGAWADVGFSTINGLCNGASCTFYASILTGGQEVRLAEGARHCLAHGNPFNVLGSGSLVGCTNGLSRCVSFARGDFQLKSNSPALGLVTHDPVKYAKFAALDVDGTPLRLDSLAGNAAGAHHDWSVEYVPQGVLLLVR